MVGESGSHLTTDRNDLRVRTAGSHHGPRRQPEPVEVRLTLELDSVDDGRTGRRDVEGDVVGTHHQLHRVSRGRIGCRSLPQFAFDDGVDDTGGEEVGVAHEGRHEAVDGRVENPLRSADLGHPTVPEHQDSVTEGQSFTLIVSDEDGRSAGGPQHGHDLVADLDAEVLVEAGERLVEKQDGGRGGQGTGQGHPLTFASGQLVGVASGVVLEGDQRQHLGDPRPTPRAPEAGEPEAHVRLDGEVGEQGMLLEDDAHTPTLRGQVSVGPIDRPAGQDHLAGIRGHEPGEHPQHRGLAAPAGPDEAEDLVRVEVEPDPVDGLGVAVALAQIPDLEGRRCVRHGRRIAVAGG